MEIQTELVSPIMRKTIAKAIQKAQRANAFKEGVYYLDFYREIDTHNLPKQYIDIEIHIDTHLIDLIRSDDLYFS